MNFKRQPILLILVVLVGLISCTPQQRLSRLISRHPYLQVYDTIFVQDTIYIVHDGVKADTFVKLAHQYDTITIEKERLIIKAFHDTITDTLYLSGECLPDIDTVYYTKEIPIQKIEGRKPRDKLRRFWEDFSWIDLLIILISIIIFSLTSRTKN